MSCDNLEIYRVILLDIPPSQNVEGIEAHSRILMAKTPTQAILDAKEIGIKPKGYWSVLAVYAQGSNINLLPHTWKD